MSDSPPVTPRRSPSWIGGDLSAPPLDDSPLVTPTVLRSHDAPPSKATSRTWHRWLMAGIIAAVVGGLVARIALQQTSWNPSDHPWQFIDSNIKLYSAGAVGAAALVAITRIFVGCLGRRTSAPSVEESEPSSPLTVETESMPEPVSRTAPARSIVPLPEPSSRPDVSTQPSAAFLSSPVSNVPAPDIKPLVLPVSDASRSFQELSAIQERRDKIEQARVAANVWAEEQLVAEVQLGRQRLRLNYEILLEPEPPGGGTWVALASRIAGEIRRLEPRESNPMVAGQISLLKKAWEVVNARVQKRDPRQWVQECQIDAFLTAEIRLNKPVLCCQVTLGRETLVLNRKVLTQDQPPGFPSWQGLATILLAHLRGTEKGAHRLALQTALLLVNTRIEYDRLQTTPPIQLFLAHRFIGESR